MEYLFSNHSLAVNLYFNDSDEICIIDLEGNTLKSIEVPIDKYLEYLVYCNDRVIFSVFDKAVYCYDVSGKQIWEYQNDLRGPRGLCTDTYGNVFVIDFMSDRMIVISKTGKHSKVLISEEDELDNKKCICLNQSDSSGFICDIDGTYLAKFNLSYE
ncbi:NID [Mytilus coruscus]|uniref:NID n=1 Tax=Mytilus coruscus TaxID=42192 RepID=A0A6J8BSF2_MYTCO|nr:NID [Mytilus coruscus]